MPGTGTKVMGYAGHFAFPGSRSGISGRGFTIKMEIYVILNCGKKLFERLAAAFCYLAESFAYREAIIKGNYLFEITRTWNREHPGRAKFDRNYRNYE